MFGGAGGIIEFRAALLASQGFAALALPYFNYEDLPQEKGLGLILELEYFEVTRYERNVKILIRSDVFTTSLKCVQRVTLERHRHCKQLCGYMII